MSTLRRLLPPLAALLVVLVVVQTTDLIACADEAAQAEHAGETHADLPLSQGGHPTPAPGESHDEHESHDGAFADCLCHVVFTPTAAVPEVGARPAPEPAPAVALAEAPPEVEPMGLDHVPLS